MTDFHELRDIDNFCVGTIGPPGERVFFLQAISDGEAITWKAEKEHVVVLASTLADVLSEYGSGSEPARITELREPVEPVFAVRQVGLRLMLDDNPDESVLVVVLSDSDQPLRDEDESDDDPSVGEGAGAAVWLRTNQAAGFVSHAASVVRDGRELAQSNGYRPDLP